MIFCLETECHDALRQIEAKQYARKAERSGFQKIEKFGIAFFQKKVFGEERLRRLKDISIMENLFLKRSFWGRI